MTSFGDVHRRFLQTFVYHPVKTEEEVVKAYELSCEEQGQATSPLDHVIEVINAKLRNHTYLQIKIAQCELTGKKFYVAVNENDAVKCGRSTSSYNKNEHNLFRMILDDILIASNGRVSTISCLNYSSLAGMTKSEINTTVMKFVKDGWFVAKDGILYMGVRGITELEPFIICHYKDNLHHCPLCKKLIFCGHQCENCSETGHIYCLKKYFASTGTHRGCPNCGADWEDWDTNFSEEDEIDDN